MIRRPAVRLQTDPTMTPTNTAGATVKKVGGSSKASPVAPESVSSTLRRKTATHAATCAPAIRRQIRARRGLRISPRASSRSPICCTAALRIVPARSMASAPPGVRARVSSTACSTGSRATA